MTHLISKLTNSPATYGAMLMIVAGLLFAVVNTLVQSLTMVHGNVSTTVAFWQYFVALLFFIPWIMSNFRQALATNQISFHIIRVIFAALGVQLWIWGLAHVPIWQAIALIMTSPFFVVIGAKIFLKEEVSPQRWIAVILGFVGGMIILAPWTDKFTYHALLPVGAALLWGLSSLTAKYLTNSEKPRTLTIYLLLLLTPINAVLALQEGFQINTNLSVWMLISAGLLTAFAQYALVKAYSVADAAYLQPFDHLKLPLNVVLGFMVFGFLPTGSMWIGTFIIISASFYLLNDETKFIFSPRKKPVNT